MTIEANKDVHVNASDIIAGKDISLTGENVDISSKDNVYHCDEKHEYKKSGLTVAVGGAGINAIESVAAPATRMTQVSDNRLKALYGYETAEKIKKNGDALKISSRESFFLRFLSVSVVALANPKDIVPSLKHKAAHCRLDKT